MKHFHSQEGEKTLKGTEDNKGCEKETDPGTLSPVSSNMCGNLRDSRENILGGRSWW